MVHLGNKKHIYSLVNMNRLTMTVTPGFILSAMYDGLVTSTYYLSLT